MRPSKVAVYTYADIVSALEGYRLYGPLTHAGLGINQGVHEGVLNENVVSGSDIVLFQREFPVNFPNYLTLITQAASSDKPVVMDLDDDLLGLPNNHPDRLKMYFAEAQVPMLTAMIQAKALTVTTPYLAGLLKAYNTNTYVLPNFLDDSIWRMNPPQAANGEKMRILYLGGITHAPDLQILLAAIQNLATMYPDRLEFIFYGANLEVSDPLPATFTHIKSETYVYADFVHIALALSADIAIAPLEDNNFNNCKSNIKYLEYTAMGLPGVYSNVIPYSGVIKPGTNGFIAASTDDWVKAISRLIDDPQLRQQIVNEAQEDVRKNWLMSTHAHLWPETYEKITRQSAPNESQLVPFISTFSLISQQMFDLHQAKTKREADLSLEVEHLTYDLETARKANIWALNEIKRVDNEKRELLLQQNSLIEPLWRENENILLQKGMTIERLEHDKARIQRLAEEKDNEIANKEKIILQKDLTIEQLAFDKAKIERVVEEKNEEIRDKEKLIEEITQEKEKNVSEKDLAIVQLENEKARIALVAESSNDRYISLIQNDIPAFEKQIDTLSVQWLDHTKRISALESDLNIYTQALNLSKLENVQYVLSKSWRLTRPLRRLLKLARRK